MHSSVGPCSDAGVRDSPLPDSPAGTVVVTESSQLQGCDPLTQKYYKVLGLLGTFAITLTYTS